MERHELERVLPRLGPDELEVVLRSVDHQLGDCLPLVHTFYPGYYVRTIVMPRETVVLGRCHRTAHWNVLSHGTVAWRAPDGSVHHLTAPCAFYSDAGVQKMLYIAEDTVWTTVHETDEIDLARLDALLIEPRINPYLGVPVGAALTQGEPCEPREQEEPCLSLA